VKRGLLLIAVGVSSCLLPRVDFDSSLGSAGTSAGGGSNAPTGGTDAGGSANPGGGRTSGAGAPSGQGGKSGAGSAGETTGNAGTPSGQGGKSGAGGGTYTGGATSSAGSGTAGRASGGTGGGIGTGGSGGSGAGTGGCGSLQVSMTDPKCCFANAPTTNISNSLAIDDLEDDDNVILPIGDRQGYWFTYSDSKTTQMPAASGGTLPPTAGNGHPCSLLPAPPACAGKTGGTAYSAGTSGLLAPATVTAPSYAGLGFDFNNRLMKSCVYGASAYHGISFWAKGNVTLRALVEIPATTSSSTTGSGTCTSICDDHFGITVALTDAATWKQFTITFADTTTFAQGGWGTPATFDSSALLGMQFQTTGSTTATTATPFNFSIDDVAFIQ
jgi:hypothetical protein